MPAITNMINGMKILLTGSSGRLGGFLKKHFESRHQVLAPLREELDLAKPDMCLKRLDGMEFDVLINCAGMVSPDVCEADALGAMQVNAESPAALASECQRRGVRMIQISTDYVFGGQAQQPLAEDAAAQPISAYGRSKLAGEQAVMAASSRALVARVSWLFGGPGRSFPDQIIDQALAGKVIEAIADKWSVPTSVSDIAIWLEHIITHHADAAGVLHLCNSGEASWHTYAEATLALAHELGLIKEVPPVNPLKLDEFTAFKARRPRYTVMLNQRLSDLLGAPPRHWRDALRESLMRIG